MEGPVAVPRIPLDGGQRDGLDGSALRESGPSFEELKRELHFTENRLALLLDSVLHPEMEQWVAEKTFVRRDCKQECEQCVARLEASVAGKMRRVWNEVKIVAAFDVEVPLRALVGCPYYERPSPVASNAVTALLSRIRELGETLPGAKDDQQEDRVKNLITRFESIDWDRRDMARIAEALQAKETLLNEVSELMKHLQEIGWNCSIHEAKREELRRKAREAENDGEVEIAQQHIRDELDVVEALMQLLLFKLQTTESSQAENVLKRRNNVSQWKLAAAQLDALKEQKIERQRECIRDKGKITRGLEYEAKKNERSREDFRERKKQYDDRLETLGARQDELMTHLEELTAQFRAVEQDLVSLIAERKSAIQARVEIVEVEAQRVADYQEFVRFATEHRSYIEQTQAMSEAAVDTVNDLQRFLMSEQDYDEHDFNYTTNLLRDVKTTALKQLNQCYNEYYSVAMHLARHIESKRKKEEDEMTRQQLMAELEKETLNPEAKRHVMAAREAMAHREALVQESRGIARKLEFVRANYLRKVKEELPPEEIVEPDDDIELELLKKQEDHLDMREETVKPIEYQILEEREDIAMVAEKVREEREQNVNRQCKKGEGRMALQLRQQVRSTRKEESEGDEEDKPLVQRAAEQHEAAALEAAARAKEAAEAALNAEAVMMSRRDPRPVAVGYDVHFERKAASPPAGEEPPGSPATPARRADGTEDDLRVSHEPRIIRSLEMRYGEGHFPPVG